ncbi:hypothetical protein [Mastigocoleus testarum]|uniref:Porin n=1 Tax=Mastigocoleus testarum BC008 TaxID=371196 RepID=A0A0V7ZHS9_9CYAN|nr:hypothetical protein [Mastigocoleus testarum]KST64056.1 hypothetical protein BC008_40390 [Mastigocoleus testarum BC008]KST64766.1 hypothetical protein BC008_41365 [Mastigocoleus testarum BC008]
MRLLKISACVLLALSTSDIASASQDGVNINQDEIRQKNLIDRLREAKKKSQNQKQITVENPNNVNPNNVNISVGIDTIAKDILNNSQNNREEVTQNNLSISNSRPILTTAEHLRKGEISISVRHRHFFSSGTARSDGLTDQPTLGISWGVTDDLELTLDFQTVDNAGPQYQGSYSAQRINDQGSTNFFQEWTLQAKQRIWQSKDGTQALSGAIAASRGNDRRPYNFADANGIVAAGLNAQTVFSLELPYTIKPDKRWQFTVSPKVAFLPEDNALYLNRLPQPNSGSFGANFGLAGAISYQLSPRLSLWGDAFIPFTGNNTINRDTGLPTRDIAYNAGLKYIINPRLAADLFISNTLANTGPLSIVTDREFDALGLGLTYIPGVTVANRRYPSHFGVRQGIPQSTHAGFSAFDGGTVPRKQLLTLLQLNEGRTSSAIRYGIEDDLEIGIFLDDISGIVDESVLGVSGKIRFLNQADDKPFTLSLAGSFARSNSVLVNLINNDRNRFESLGLEKTGFSVSNESVELGEVFVVTLSAPLHYKFPQGGSAWFTPTLGYVQRTGLEIAGFNVGTSIPLSPELDAIAEVGFNLGGEGNAFIDNTRKSIIPWSLGVRWEPKSLLGKAFSGLQLEAYLSNRVGSSPFETLRVRADNETRLGIGMLLPIQF